MKHRKILAALTAAALGISLAGCSKPKNNKEDAPSDPPIESSLDNEGTESSVENQVTGKVTSFDGTKITIELGELKRQVPDRNSGNGGNGKSDSNRKDRSNDGQRERQGGMFGYAFNSTGKSSTYDLSGLKEIKLENDSDDTPDTVEEIKTGDVVVIEVGKDGAVTSLTVKDLNGRFRNRDGQNGGNRNENGKRSDKTGNNNRKNRSTKNNRPDDQN